MLMKDRSLNLNFTPYTNTDPEWIIDLNIKCTTIKLLGKKIIRENLEDLGLDKEFTDLTQSIQEEPEKLDPIQN